ncbi:MAG: hypothetical protein QOK37_3639 [Thermoanaerobaculia bacterium]|jgi:hypothetical protein|nr:hypothetical protein [Thermoanaerobaculia bacterium]
MSDYLTNLAARALESATAIRPLLASFYEAPQRGVAIPPEPIAESGEVANDMVAIPAQHPEDRAAVPSQRAVITADQSDGVLSRDDVDLRTEPIMAAVVNDETSATSTAASPLPRRAVDRVAEAANGVVGETPREQHGRRKVRVPIAEPNGAISDTTRDEMAQRERIAMRVAPPEEHDEAEARRSETEPRALIPRNRQRPHPQLESPSLSPRSLELPARAFDDAQPAGVASPRERVGSAREQLENPERPERASSRISMPPRITPSRIVTETQPAPRTQSVLRSSRQHPQATAAPDVHITIGRVEVRAVPAAELPSRGRSAAPSGLMNLDDYLRRRDGGGRR